MRLLVLGALFYLVVSIGGVAAYGLLRRWGAGAGAAWAAARPLGWVVAGYAAWLAGLVGLASWWVVAPLALGLLLLATFREWRRTPWLMLLDAEVIGVVAFVAVAILRFPVMNVIGTEKPMDLAVLSSLLRAAPLPPVDPWLAGNSLPYYYWGFIPWVAPVKLLHLPSDAAFNLLVAVLAGVTAQAAWALARAVGGSRRSAWMASFLVVLAGTPDGWRQLASGSSLGGLDLWGSSRQIAGAITEYPLFTFQLGDLHPHLLALPLALTALFLARAPTSGLPAALRVGLTALLYGAGAAANPWIAVPLGLALLLLRTSREEGFLFPRGEGRRVWVETAAMGAFGWLAFAPFWLALSPGVKGLGAVGTPTRVSEFVLFLGAMVLPPLLVAAELIWRGGGLQPARRQLALAVSVAGAVTLSLVTRRPVVSVLLVMATVFTSVLLGGRRRRARPVWALTIVALLLLAFPEVLYLRDPYGGDLYRMNTVFKATHLAFALLAVAVPVLLGWLRRRRPTLAVAAAALVLAAGLPHLAGASLRVRGWPETWAGLGWMTECDRGMVGFLRHQGVGTVLVEAVGEPYSDAGRLAAASGVPAVLGWENHERVWRGNRIDPELARRRRLVEEIYTSGDPTTVRADAVELGAQLVAVGSVERRTYPAAGLAAVKRAGRLAFSEGGCFVVRVDE